MATKDNSIVPVVEKQISPIVAQSQALEITSQKTMETASTMRETLKKAQKALKDDKEKLTKPINVLLKEIRGRYTTVEDVIETSLTAINKKMGAYQTEQDAIAEAERAKIAARTKGGKGNLSPETAVAKMQEIDTPASRIESAHGVTEFMDVKKFEVVDFALLPIEYKLVNDVAIRTAMRQGTEVAGVRYWTEKVPKSAR